MEVRWDVALTKDGNRVWIDDDFREALFCPECDGEMIPVRGEQRQHHFRHSVDSNCNGESAKHWTKKYQIADALEGIGSVVVEGKIGGYVADVLFENKWAFEVVFSNAPSEDKLRDLRENLVVFNFNVRTVWDQEDFSPYNALFDETDFAGIVKRIGNDIISENEVNVCSCCREVRGLNSQLYPGARCYDCFFSPEAQDELKRIREGAEKYREAKMR
jgi:hypothetical protein